MASVQASDSLLTLLFLQGMLWQTWTTVAAQDTAASTATGCEEPGVRWQVW